MSILKPSLLVAVILLANASGPAFADTIISGTITDPNGYMPVVMPTWDDPNRVVLAMSGSDVGGVWAYGSESWPGFANDWNIAYGVTDVHQIVDASAYTLASWSGYLALGQFAVARGNTGYWGVVQPQALWYNATAQRYEGTFRWWYQSDGSGDFSAPEPTSWLMIAGGLAGAAAFRKRMRA